MKFIDFFAGVGGFRKGLEMAGHECVGFVEWDKFARKSYQSIFNTEGEYTEDDIRAVRANELPRANIWCFGFPCQDISIAGSQLLEQRKVKAKKKNFTISAGMTKR